MKGMQPTCRPDGAERTLPHSIDEIPSMRGSFGREVGRPVKQADVAVTLVAPGQGFK